MVRANQTAIYKALADEGITLESTRESGRSASVLANAVCILGNIWEPRTSQEYLGAVAVVCGHLPGNKLTPVLVGLTR